jgi:Coenzyme PQQ synthesis protein D (PqqD)
MFPRARQDNLTVRELPEETLVYDKERHKAHCLNRTAALVWRHCDGATSLDELGRLLAAELGVAEAVEVVGLALEQLQRRHLLAEAPLPLADRLSRRDALKKLALTAAALPLVMTIATKAAAQSMSDGEGGGGGGGGPSVVVQPTVVIQTGSSSSQTRTQATGPCRTKGQSCLASASGQQGSCCAGLKCNGVSQGAGVCA